MNLSLKNLLINVGYYSLTLVAGPYACLSIDAALDLPRGSPHVLRYASILCAGLGITLQAWCILVLQSEGRGTPSPLFPPARLVLRGPYRWVSNPLNLGEVLVFLALAGWFGSLTLLAYTLSAWWTFHLFITCWEEPRHLRLFGEEFVHYKQTANRWLPRLIRSADAGDTACPDPSRW